MCLFSKPDWLFLGISRIDASCLIPSGNLYTYHTKMYLINLSPSHLTILQTKGVQIMHRVSPRSHLNYIKALKVFKNCFRFMALSWRGNFEDNRDWFWPNIEQKPLLSLSLYFQWKCHINSNYTNSILNKFWGMLLLKIMCYLVSKLKH